MSDKELRERLRAIVTRNGKTGRIPEVLEAELDDLLQLFTEYGRAERVDEARFIDANIIGSPRKATTNEKLKDRIKQLTEGK